MYLVTMSENEKRVIFAIILVAIVVLAVIGLLGAIVFRIMKWQSKKMDVLCHDVTVTRVVSDKKHFISYGRKKNWREFFRQAWIPVTILLANMVFILIYEACVGWNYSPFSLDNGFSSLFLTWKISDTEYVNWGLIAFRKWVVTHYPTFVPGAWAGYIFGTVLIGAGGWYLVTIQCLVSRTVRLYKLSNSIFSKSLEDYNQNKAITDQVNNGNINNPNSLN